MSRHPNILVLLSDQHRADFMGCAGHPQLHTPNADALAQRGVRYERAYCANPLCVPSRMSLMTGRSSSSIEVWGNGNHLSSEIPTFAHGLGAAGYETVLAGKMHFCGPDQHHGFDRRLVGEVGSNLLEPGLRENESGDSWMGNTAYALAASGAGRCGAGYFDQAVADASVEFINDESRERPWCLVAGFMAPHNPFVCSPESFARYEGQLDLESRAIAELRRKAQPYLDGYAEFFGITEVDEETQLRALAAYCGLCTDLDAQIGRVLDTLEASGQVKDTIVVYLSDHGEMAGDAGLWFKTNLSESSVKVPLIIAPPDCDAAGSVCSDLVSLMDLAPTLLDFASAEPLPSTEGVSLRMSALATANIERGRDFIWAESVGVPNCRLPFALWSGKWKYVYLKEREEEYLFNLQEDPLELSDLAASEPEVLKTMRARRDSVWSYSKSHQALENYNSRIRYIRQSNAAWASPDLPKLEVPEAWHTFTAVCD